MADFLGRLPAFDPRRGALGAFAGRIMANRAYAVARDIRRRRWLHGAKPVSLDAPVDAAGIVTLGELVPEEAGLSAMLGHWIDPIAAVERRLDLECALARLDGKSRSLASALLKGSAHLLARAGLGSRSALYRQTRDLRLALMAAGITAA
jgi:RNA polymerase sigma-70 factor (ECF subfamily)